MRVSHAVNWTQKAGNQLREYEDAFAANMGHDGRVWRFAVADGATDAYRSGAWARALVEQATVGELNLSEPPTLAAIQETFTTTLASDIETGALPWFAEEKARLGAFAALAVLELRDRGGDRTWRASAVGDSCLFHIRHDCLVACFPLETADAFGSSPYLVGSQSDPADIAARVEFASGGWQPGDEFLLASDALAEWFLGRVEAEERPWEEFQVERSRANFEGWVETLRRVRRIRNDDTTVLHVWIADDVEPAVPLGMSFSSDSGRHPDAIPDTAAEEGDRALADPTRLSGSDADPGGGLPRCGTEDWQI